MSSLQFNVFTRFLLIHGINKINLKVLITDRKWSDPISKTSETLKSFSLTDMLDIRSPQRMNHYVFGDPLTFPEVSTAGSNVCVHITYFYLSFVILRPCWLWRPLCNTVFFSVVLPNMFLDRSYSFRESLSVPFTHCFVISFTDVIGRAGVGDTESRALAMETFWLAKYQVLVKSKHIQSLVEPHSNILSKTITKDLSFLNKTLRKLNMVEFLSGYCRENKYFEDNISLNITQLCRWLCYIIL